MSKGTMMVVTSIAARAAFCATMVAAVKISERRALKKRLKSQSQSAARRLYAVK